MSITEAERHQLYQRLEAVLGHDEASVLMEHLPPVGWADVATKRDLDHLGQRLGSEIAALREQVVELKEGLRDQRNQVFGVLGANTALIAVALAVVA